MSVLLHPKEPHHHIAECGAQVLSRPHLSVKEASLLIFVVIENTVISTCTLSSVHNLYSCTLLIYNMACGYICCIVCECMRGGFRWKA